MKKTLFALGLIGLISFSACKEDAPPPDTPNNPEPRTALIGIEGVSPNGISSVDRYLPTSGEHESNLYRKANLEAMGSNMVDMLVDEEEGVVFFLLAGSDKIVVADLETMELIKVIPNMQQIQRMVKVAEKKYYVTTWENNGIYVIQGGNFNVRKTIETGQGPTEMLVYNDLAFIVNTGFLLLDSTVTIMRTSVDTIVDTLIAGINPNSLVIDNENFLWVLSEGESNVNPNLNGVGTLYKYRMDSILTAIDSAYGFFPFDTVFYFNDNQLKPRELTLNPEGRQLFFIGNNPTGAVFDMFTTQNRVTEVPTFTGNYYQLKFDPLRNELYALTAPGLTNDGTGSLEIYAPDGTLKNGFKIGVRPVDVEFY